MRFHQPEIPVEKPIGGVRAEDPRLEVVQIHLHLVALPMMHHLTTTLAVYIIGVTRSVVWYTGFSSNHTLA